VCVRAYALRIVYYYYYTSLIVISELRSCVKVEVAVLGSPSLIALMVSMDVRITELKISGAVEVAVLDSPP